MRVEPTTATATARSILSCPATLDLTVDGVDDVLAECHDVALQDQDGVPTFSCPSDRLLARAASGRGRRAVLSLESGVGAPGSAERSSILSLGGRLVRSGRDACECCSETRDVVVLVVERVALTPPSGGAPVQLSVEDFAAPEHRLNRGFLQRCVEHASQCHQDELRHAVAAIVDRPIREIAGVTLSDLTTRGVQVRWVDPDGAHGRDVAFPHAAVTPAELGELLRRELSAGLC